MTTHSSSPGPVVALVDGTGDGLRAVRYAILRARDVHTSVRVVHSMPVLLPLAPEAAAIAAIDIEKVGRAVIDEALDLVRELAPETETSSALWRESTYDMIVTESREAAYLVLGSRPRSLWRPSLGSVVAVAASSAHCPVVAVPDPWSEDKDDGSVVVAVSHREEIDAMVASGIAEARLRGTDVVVIHAWRPPDPYYYATATRSEEQRWAGEVEREIAECTAGTRAENPDVPVRVEARFQFPGHALADLAEHAGLLIVGRHHALLGGVLPRLGRVPHAALELGVCPVEILPTGEPEAMRASW